MINHILLKHTTALYIGDISDNFWGFGEKSECDIEIPNLSIIAPHPIAEPE